MPTYAPQYKGEAKEFRKDKRGLASQRYLDSWTSLHLWTWLPPSPFSQKNEFLAKLIHHEERAKSYTDNLSNFNNPLVSNTEEGNDNSTLKDATIQPSGLNFVETMRKEINDHEEDNHWILAQRRELYWKKNIIHLVLKEKEGPIWETYQAQGPPMCPQGYATMGGKLLEDLLPSVQQNFSQSHAHTEHT